MGPWRLSKKCKDIVNNSSASTHTYNELIYFFSNKSPDKGIYVLLPLYVYVMYMWGT